MEDKIKKKNILQIGKEKRSSVENCCKVKMSYSICVTLSGKQKKQQQQWAKSTFSFDVTQFCFCYRMLNVSICTCSSILTHIQKKSHAKSTHTDIQ